MGKVKILKFSDGERYPILVDEKGLPDFWVTMYVTANLRLSHTATSIENIIRDIVHFHLWEELESRVVVEEFSEGLFLSKEDIHSLRDHCLIKTTSARKQLHINKSQNIASIGVLEPYQKKFTSTVSKNHFANRISHIAHYLDFIAGVVCRNKSNYTELFPLIRDMITVLLAQKSKAVRKIPNSQNLKIHSPEMYQKFMRVVDKSSSKNPFKSDDIKERNELMLRILHETGMRSGELLALRISDIDFINNTLSIVRRHNDKIDDRKRQPVVKTLPRDTYITPELALDLRSYILETRVRIKKAKTHPILFVTHKSGRYAGCPISDAAFRNRILKPVIDKFPDLKGVTRHGFRHNFNYLLSKKIDRHNDFVRKEPELAKKEGMTTITEKEEMDIRKRLNGWSSDSTAGTYNKRHIQEKTNTLMMSDMTEQLRGVKSNEQD